MRGDDVNIELIWDDDRWIKGGSFELEEEFSIFSGEVLADFLEGSDLLLGVVVETCEL